MAPIVVLEGLDGAGKGTQTKLLGEAAAARGWRVGTLSFPRYGQNVFAEKIADYLNGGFGPLEALPVHFPALLYAGDRFASKGELLELCSTHDLVIVDRYVASNLAYQSARCEPEHRGEFIRWLEQVEHEAYGMPAPALTIELRLPAEQVLARVLQKQQREYTERKADLHEANRRFLERCAAAYELLSRTYRRGEWAVVDCFDAAGRSRDTRTLGAEIWSAIERVLPFASR